MNTNQTPSNNTDDNLSISSVVLIIIIGMTIAFGAAYLFNLLY